MAEMLSPGVYVTEIDDSTIVPSVSNSIAVFSGQFTKGTVDEYKLITSVSELISMYGYPTDTNYNDWFQCYNFLQYGNKLLIARAANTNGSVTQTGDIVLIDAVQTGGDISVGMVTVNDLSVGQTITFGTDSEVYEIVAIDPVAPSIEIDRGLSVLSSESVVANTTVNIWTQTTNGIVEAVDDTNITQVTIQSGTFPVANSAVTAISDYLPSVQPVANAFEFTNNFTPIFTNPNSKLQFIAKNPGTSANNLSICVADPSAFLANSTAPASHVTRYAFEGVILDDLFEYAPTGTEIAIVIKENDTIVEQYVVDFDETAKDFNNKSTYIENVINVSSNYIYVVDNSSANTNNIANYVLLWDETNSTYIGNNLTFEYANDAGIQEDDLLVAYELFNNKEEIDIDIVIANELDNGASVAALLDTRQDCLGFIGPQYIDVVGKKSTNAIQNLLSWRKGTGTNPSNTNINYNNMFVISCGNYKYQYDRYNDKYRWINIAGDIAGLRAETSQNRASWWASAGLERGQIKNVTKLAFNPTQGQRDMLYKNGINPIVAFPGQGTVMWGQKTLLAKPSSFDRANVRGLFNTLERALSKMAKYQVMEFNDNFTRNRIISMIKPYLGTVQAGRGITDFLVICDESNNTPDVISRNQLIVDIYIKPVYVAEYINLRFTNAGTNSFAEVIGG